jgi:hypothetical protein
VVSRLVSALAADAPRALKAIRAARAAARARAWELAGQAAPVAGQWPLGAYQLKRADQVDLVRHDLPLGASETTGSG